MKVAIIDYRMGNLFSVQHACGHVGLESIITSEQKVISESDGVILPGVGAFSTAMKHLNELNLIETILEVIQNGKPFMGICLGMQLLFTESEEFGNNSGLGVIDGKVKKFPDHKKDGSRLTVPQIGWNQIFKTDLARDSSLIKNISDGEFMYFVHSYYVEPDDTGVVFTKTNYEEVEYCSSLLKENVFASQFHPEKSAEKGIEIYRNWANLHRH
jgi:imidazole glycerol-phosphate synthase subunit HisH